MGASQEMTCALETGLSHDDFKSAMTPWASEYKERLGNCTEAVKKNEKCGPTLNECKDELAAPVGFGSNPSSYDFPLAIIKDDDGNMVFVKENGEFSSAMCPSDGSKGCVFTDKRP